MIHWPLYYKMEFMNLLSHFLRIIEQHKVSAIFSVPTAFRVIRRVDPEIKFGRKYSTSSLRTIFIAGEHCDVGMYHNQFIFYNC